jgi:hypothetical protein
VASAEISNRNSWFTLTHMQRRQLWMVKQSNPRQISESKNLEENKIKFLRLVWNINKGGDSTEIVDAERQKD